MKPHGRNLPWGAWKFDSLANSASSANVALNASERGTLSALVPVNEQAPAETHGDEPVDRVNAEELERLSFTHVQSEQRWNHKS